MPVIPYGLPPNGIEGKRPGSNGADTRAPADNRDDGSSAAKAQDHIRLGPQASDALRQQTSGAPGALEFSQVDAQGIADRLRSALSQSSESIAGHSIDEVLSLFGPSAEAAT